MSVMENLDLYAYSPYFHCYCEENVYRLLEKLVIDPPAAPEGVPAPKLEGYAAFLTSYNAKPGQEAQPGAWQTSVAVVSGPKPVDVVYWDYHCVAVVKETRPATKEGETEPNVRWWVCDFDTKMGKGKHVIPMELFFGFTLSAAGKNAVALIETKVRFIPSVDFLTYFRTDRSQMYLRHVVRDKRYKQIPPAELDRHTNFQEKPPGLPRIQGSSPAAGLVKGEISLQQAKDRLNTIYSGKSNVTNKHENTLPQILNTQDPKACGNSELVGIKAIGQWIKTH